jgi:hypothetical protein
MVLLLAEAYAQVNINADADPNSKMSILNICI